MVQTSVALTEEERLEIWIGQDSSRRMRYITDGSGSHRHIVSQKEVTAGEALLTMENHGRQHQVISMAGLVHQNYTK